MARNRFLKSFERTSRRALERALKKLPDVSATVSGAVPPEPSSILVIRPDSRLGNLVLTMPLLRSLRKRFPESRIALLASDRFADLPAGQGVEVIRAEKSLMARRPWTFPGFVRELRDASFDCAMDASHPFAFSLSGALSARLSGARVRIGFASGDCEGWFTHEVPCGSRDDHESLTIHSLGSLWQGWPGWEPPRLIARSPASGGGIGMHVGASRGKSYPPDKLSRLVEGLASTGRVTLFWGSTAERDLADSISTGGAVVSESLSMDGLLDSLAGLDLFVTADNGPMHVASALGTRVLALFRVSNQARFGPLSDGSVVLFDPEGSEPDDVLRTAAGILDRKAGRDRF